MARIKVRARALDMLGRQQMAGVPNALHELLKNTYDAYAAAAKIDYYRQDRLLTLADDGMGMTLEEFEARWLTLGTESKVEAGNAIGPPYKDPDKPERRPLGEKGIGRLAIATVGPQVLIVSKADRGQGICPTVVSLLNWSFFEIPGINMDDLLIPLLELPPGHIPQLSHLAEMSSELLANYEALVNQTPPLLQSRIQAELDHLNRQLPELMPLIQNWADSCSRGTIFVVIGVDPILEREIDDDDENELPPPLLKNLRGFVNTMTNNEMADSFKVEFNDHKRDGTTKEIIGESEFFNPGDFQIADQNIQGEFDEYGQFIGKVSIYHQPEQKYTLPWDGSRGKPVQCGPFKIKFGYLQGLKKESLADDSDWSELFARLAKFGGLYIYRDGIRVLPYGNSDLDYLNIERRRTKAAKDWVFSYRRMFGAIELDNVANAGLIEKAGREGFRENLAYRQFRSMLENLFKRLAFDWFRDKTAEYGNYRERLGELQKEAEALEKRQKSVQGKKEALAKQLESFFNYIDTGCPQKEINELKDLFQGKIANYNNTLFCRENDQSLLGLEKEIDQKLDAIRAKCTISEPRNIPLSKSATHDIVKSKSIYSELNETIFKPFENEYKQILTAFITQHKLEISHMKRLEQTFQTRTQGEKKRAKMLASDATEDTKTLQKEVNERTRASMYELNNTFSNLSAKLARQDLSSADTQDIEKLRYELDAEVAEVADTEIDRLECIRNQIQSVLESIQEGFSLDEITARSEEKAEEAEERLDSYIELAHMGTAIGIIQHEFETTVNGIRKSLKALNNVALPEIHDDVKILRNNFEYLDAYLAMFTPLNRKLFRRQIDLSGKQIRTYILQMFGSRLERHKIEWVTTDAFETRMIKAYPSTFLPPIINIVDNAIFWLSRDTTGHKLDYTGLRELSFDADERGFLIGNNGPIISERDADRIFEMSFTTKLRGRGMGLNLAKSALKKDGYDITLVQSGSAGPPFFLITTERPEE